MKILLLLLGIAFAGCGTKSNEAIAKDLITEKLKTTLPDFNSYKSVSFGNLGTASIPFEESDLCMHNVKALKTFKDSILIIEQQLKGNIEKPNGNKAYVDKMNQMNDSIKMLNEKNKADKQSYLPEKLFKLTHTYTIQDKPGLEKNITDAFFLDKDLKRVVKIVHVN